MNKPCRKCLYFDLGCSYYRKHYRSNKERACDFYTPITTFDEDMEVENIIESRRTEFREEWFKYIEENEDCFIFNISR